MSRSLRSTFAARPFADTVRAEDRELRCTLLPEGPAETVGAMLLRHASDDSEGTVVLERGPTGFHGSSRARFVRDVEAFAAFLRVNGIRPGDRIAAVSRNRAALLVVEFAVMGMGAVFVPLFAGYGADQLQALLAHAEPEGLVVADDAILQKTGVPASARFLVVFDTGEPKTAEPADDRTKARIVTYAEALATCDDPEPMASWVANDPNAPCMIMYTSGTSGLLKGVILSHDNILSQQRALAQLRRIGPGDRFLSYLPWHHSFGGLFEKYSALYNRAPLAVDDSYGKDFARQMDNWNRVQPTVFFSVPKVYQDLVNHIHAHPEDEAGIFHPELHFVFTAAAPLPEPISAFFAERGIAVMEGWGLTETAPCCTVTDPRERRAVAGVVGYPIPGVRIRIADDGEILVRGPNVMRGYFRNRESTERAFPGDGWFHTGDLGSVDDGALRLFARKDRIFKLLNAEKVNPSPIETRLMGASRFIRFAVVAGGGHGFLSALIFLDFDRIASEFGDDRTRAEQEVKTDLERAIRTLNAETPVKYEHVKVFAVMGRELAIETGELTPSLKVKVTNVLLNSAEFVEAIYDPSEDCDCRFLRRVMRLDPDDRTCFRGKPCTLDACHACGPIIRPEEQNDIPDTEENHA